MKAIIYLFLAIVFSVLIGLIWVLGYALLSTSPLLAIGLAVVLGILFVMRCWVWMWEMSVSGNPYFITSLFKVRRIK